MSSSISPATPPHLSAPLATAIHELAATLRGSTSVSPISVAFDSASPQPTWLVAYSGGVDSTALLHALHVWQQAQPPETAPRIVAVMVNHGWRTPPTPELADAMAQCKAWQIPLVLVPITKTTKPTETEARTARYEALKALAHREKASVVWLAHHADDQLETMLIRLCRGTGLDGIQGMSALSPLLGDDSIVLARPWLYISKQSIVDYATTHTLRFQNDPSNADTAHPRNHIRHVVLPALAQAFPQATDSLKRFQRVATETVELAEHAIADVWPMVWDDTLGLDTTRLSQCSPSFQNAVIRQFLKHHQLLYDFSHVQRVRAFITGESGNDSLDPATTSGSLLSVERPTRPLTNKTTHWFLRASQHRLTLISKSPADSGSPDVRVSTDSDTPLAETIKPLAFRLMDLFPLRRPPAAVISSDEDDASETSPLNSLLLEDILDEETLLETPLLEAGGDNPDKELSSRGVSTDALEEKPPINEPDAETETLALVPETPPQEARPKVQTLSLASGHEFVIERLTGDDVIPHPLPVGTHSTVYVALEPFLVETLTIRTERPGDRFHPMGSMTSMRLTSYLTNQLGEKRPKSNNTPVLACGDEILWAVGVGVAEALRVTRRPTHRLSWVTAATSSSPSAPKTELTAV